MKLERKGFLEAVLAIAVALAFLAPGSTVFANNAILSYDIIENFEGLDPSTIVSIQPASQVVEKGATFVFSVYVEPSEPIMTVSFNLLSFDASLIQVDSIVKGNLSSNWFAWIDPSIDNVSGEITYACGVVNPKTNAITDPGSFVNITCHALENFGISDLDLEGVLIANITAVEIPVDVVDGSVTVGAEDTIPPETTCKLEGEIEEYIYVSNVDITLNATDDMSGVAYTMYKLDGKEWQKYEDSFVVSEDSNHTVYYYSVDNVGNREDEKNVRFKIDKTAIHDVGVKEIAEPSGPPSFKTGTALSENFDGTWVSDPDGDPYMVPVGWDIDGICTASQQGHPSFTHYWSQFDDSIYPLSHSQPYCAGLWWSDGSGGDPPDRSQDEWLKTPEIDISRYASLMLEFYSCYTMNSYGAHPDAHDYIKVSIDGGTTWDIVGDLCHDDGFYFPDATGGPAGTGWNWNEYPPLIDLSRYDGSNSLMIAFHYEGSGETLPRGIWMVDDVTLTGTEKWPPGTYPVEAVVKNYGAFNETGFNVSAQIWLIVDGEKDNLFYEDNVTVTTIMNPGDEIPVAFDDVTFSDADAGKYQLNIITYLDGDGYPENDQETLFFVIKLFDTTPPATNCILEGEIVDGVYISDVTVTLTAMDDMSGVAYTMYKLDGTEWQKYEDSFVVSEDGDYTVYYYSVDNAGNREGEKSRTFIISHPEISIGLISGGFGVSAVIKNTGITNITVEWSIVLDGGFILLGRETAGTIDIPTGEEVTVHSDLILGIGKVTITATASDAEETVDGVVFIVFVRVFH